MNQRKRGHFRGVLTWLGAALLSITATACLNGVGSECAGDEECGLASICLTEDEGFPGGYCTIEDCDQVGCDLNSECFVLDINGDDRVVCLEFCTIDLQCDRLDYECFDVDGENVCLPSEGASGGQAPSGSIGSGCDIDSECDEDLCLTNFRGGYCSSECSSNSDCPSGSHCEDFGCLQNCSNNDQCRSGYECLTDELNAPSCVPGNNKVVKNPNGQDDGDPCVSDVNCKGGACLREGEGNPGGYCTTLDCDNDTGCNGGICVINNANGVCRSECDGDGDCRDGYKCVTQAQQGYCVAEGGGKGGVNVAEFEIECQRGDTLTFTVPSGASGFYIAPFTESDVVIPSRLKGPNIDLDLINDFNFYSLNSQLLETIAPLQFPGSDQREFGGDLSDWGGSYELDVQTNASEVCFYVIPSQVPGTVLDINFYLVGVPGVSASGAEGNRDIQSMISTVRSLYSKAGVSLGTIRFLEVSSADERRFSNIRDFNDVFELVTRSKNPGSSANELLSVNVFLIEEFNIPQAPGLLGVSLGLPGVQGVHGSVGTGLIFTSINLKASPASLGQTMAHEIGHFLGLRHTTEHGGDSHDPISDTDRCSDPERGSRCPDATNFMFPFSLGNVTQEQVTDGQSFVIRRSGLVK